MQKEEIKFQSSNIFEGMTSLRSIIYAMDNGISNRRIEQVLLSHDKMRKNAKEIAYLRAISNKYGFDIVECSDHEIDALALGSSHGGILCRCTEREIPAFDEKFILPDSFYCMMDGIEDPYNFGYSLRTLYASGCAGVLLPKRNWMSAAGVVCRSSAGASERFSMYTGDALDIVLSFKKSGYKVVCAEERTDNVLGKCELKLPLLLLVGGEKRGISKRVIHEADMLVKINYAREFRASLSAASATTIFAYEIARQNFL